MSQDDYNEKSVDATLARIEVKLDTVLKVSDAHEVRISSVEKKQWWLSGATAAFTFVATRLFGK